VGGISLVGRAIRCALAANIMDYVLVSTEDSNIKREAMLHGAQVPFMRPADLAQDDSSMIDTLIHAIEQLEAQIQKRASVIVLIEPTNPFRTPEKVRQAVKLFLTGKYKSVITVCPLERAPQNIFVKGEVLTPFIEKPKTRFNRRQEMKYLCRVSSVAYVVGRDEFLVRKQLILPPTGYVDTTNTEAINIDEELDLEFANFIAKKYNL
jgi:CMP-N-acetylneuraminic acid synthetase